MTLLLGLIALICGMVLVLTTQSIGWGILGLTITAIGLFAVGEWCSRPR